MAPVVVVDDQVEGKVTPTRVDGIMLELEAKNGQTGKEDQSAGGRDGRQEEGEQE